MKLIRNFKALSTLPIFSVFQLFPARSPVYTHLNVSLDGLSTIRAFNAEQILIEEFDNHQDTHTACWFSFISASCAFGFALDILCFVLVFVVIFSFLLLDTGNTLKKHFNFWLFFISELFLSQAFRRTKWDWP